jgi:hypothetical protein
MRAASVGTAPPSSSTTSPNELKANNQNGNNNQQTTKSQRTMEVQTDMSGPSYPPGPPHPYNAWQSHHPPHPVYGMSMPPPPSHGLPYGSLGYGGMLPYHHQQPQPNADMYSSPYDPYASARAIAPWAYPPPPPPLPPGYFPHGPYSRQMVPSMTTSPYATAPRYPNYNNNATGMDPLLAELLGHTPSLPLSSSISSTSTPPSESTSGSLGSSSSTSAPLSSSTMPPTTLTTSSSSSGSSSIGVSDQLMRTQLANIVSSLHQCRQLLAAESLSSSQTQQPTSSSSYPSLADTQRVSHASLLPPLPHWDLVVLTVCDNHVLNRC